MQYYKLVASLAGEEVAATRKRNSAERIAISAKSNELNKLFHDRFDSGKKGYRAGAELPQGAKTLCG